MRSVSSWPWWMSSRLSFMPIKLIEYPREWQGSRSFTPPHGNKLNPVKQRHAAVSMRYWIRNGILNFPEQDAISFVHLDRHDRARGAGCWALISSPPFYIIYIYQQRHSDDSFCPSPSTSTSFPSHVPQASPSPARARRSYARSSSSSPCPCCPSSPCPQPRLSPSSPPHSRYLSHSDHTWSSLKWKHYLPRSSNSCTKRDWTVCKHNS